MLFTPLSALTCDRTGPIALLTISCTRNDQGLKSLYGMTEPTETSGSFTSLAAGSSATNSEEEMNRSPTMRGSAPYLR